MTDQRKRDPRLKTAAGGSGSDSGGKPQVLHAADVLCEIVSRAGTDGYWVIVYPSEIKGLLNTDIEYSIGERVPAIVSATLPKKQFLYLHPMKDGQVDPEK